MICPMCQHASSKPVGCKDDFNLVRCTSCYFVYVTPLPETIKLHSLYDDYRQTENYLRKLKKKVFTSKVKVKRISKYLDSTQKTFLDVGCSIGATVVAAHQLGFESMGIDPDKVALKKAKELFQDCEFQAVTTQDLVATGKRFDVIYCAEVIEHVPDPHDFMRSLVNLLNPNGVLYLTTPDAGHCRVLKDFVSWNRVTPPEHICFFTRDNMKTLLDQHGMQVIKFYWSHRANMRVIAKNMG